MSKPYYVRPEGPSNEFKDGMAVLRMCGYVSRQVYLEAIGHMEDKYPGRGWIDTANKLEDWYSERGLPVSEKGQGIVVRNVSMFVDSLHVRKLPPVADPFKEQVMENIAAERKAQTDKSVQKRKAELHRQAEALAYAR